MSTAAHTNSGTPSTTHSSLPQLVDLPSPGVPQSPSLEYVQNDELTFSSLHASPAGGSTEHVSEGAPPLPPRSASSLLQVHANFVSRLKTAISSKPAIALPLDTDHRSVSSVDSPRIALPEDRILRDSHIDVCPHCSHCSRAVRTADQDVCSRSKKFCQRHFRPMRKVSNYKPLLHLALLNPLLALGAWLYIFVCTITGATLLFALPLGLLVCFLNILGARVFARWELAIQAYFHGPPPVDSPYRPMPIFFRYRQDKVEDVEMGANESGLRIRERSFLRNVHAMITDSTTYQALFYFIVIKPAIASLLTVFFTAVTPVAFILIFPAPHFLKLTRRIGVWQANIAVEGLVGGEWYKGYARVWQDSVTNHD